MAHVKGRQRMHHKLDENTIINLLETGIDEFALHGLEKANINVIAKKAGVSVGVIYKYYAGKDAFFLACVSHSLKLLEEAMRDIMENGSDLKSALRLLVRDLIDGAEKHGNYYVMYNEITSGSCRKYAKKLAHEIESRTAQIYTALIEKGQQEGTISIQGNPGLFAFFMDNLLMMLQFSYSCDYYRERMKIFCGEDVLDDTGEMTDAIAAFFEKIFS